ncbi:hypothetical protein Clacol_008958 [Clathrus columnatus]|uniref:ATP synthase subunit d, mitochondrial n=1 Tax=Clathrus columnatus TaxID=1419009 RepID=A0AAV5AQN2_9AGAM|nr:hypothetical protein Clacol_008958 [Clathrus columnatus]
MPYFATLEAIQETINALGLTEQINAPVFWDELKRQINRLEKLPISLSPPPPPSDFKDYMSSLKWEVVPETASPEEIAERNRLREKFTKELEGYFQRDGVASKPMLPPYPAGPMYIEKVVLTPEEIASNRKMIEDTEKLVKSGQFYTTYQQHFIDPTV